MRKTEHGDGVEVLPSAPSDPSKTPSHPSPGAARSDAVPDKARGGKRQAPRRAPGQARPRPSRRPPSVTRPTERRPTTQPPIAEPGERVGRYEIERLLDRGGMGAVYQVFDPAANRHVALKVLAAGAPEADRRRFQREVEVQGNIQHAHIMPILDSGALGRSRFFTMELLKDPLSLEDLVAACRSGEASRDPLLRPVSTPEGLLRHVVLPVCQAVYHANQREGVLHRDLKPGNILVDRNGLRPFVIDFGVCSLLERKNQRLAHLPTETPTRGSGGAIRVTGTLLYMPPEQARGQADRRGDVWALGAILHHVVTGAAPVAPAYRGSVPRSERMEGLRLLAEQAARAGQVREAAEARRKIARLETGGERTLEDLQKEILAGRYLPRPKDLSRGLDDIIAKAMAPLPDGRHRHALELHDDLLAWIEGRPTRAGLERRGAVGRTMYRVGLRLRRHRKAAALLVVAGGLGAWAAFGVIGSGASQGVPSPATPAQERALFEEAEQAAEEGRIDDAVNHARRALSHEPTAQRAHQLLDGLLARQEAERWLVIAEERLAGALAYFEARDWQKGREQLIRLEELIAVDRLAPLEYGGTQDQQARIATLREFARGRRRVRIESALPFASPVAAPVDAQSGHVVWPAAVRLADPAPLPCGPWVVGRTGASAALWPIDVLPGRGALVVPAPVDPADLPEGRAYVIGGRTRSPQGDQDVGPLLWDLREVTAARYARFLASLPEEERARRVPRTRTKEGALGVHLWTTDPGGHVPSASALDRPVENISFHDAEAFARFEGGRLPSAAEWAWAATGSIGRLTPIPPAAIFRSVRYGAPDGGSAPVGANDVDRSAFGLFDMAGNVCEFTATLTSFRGKSGWLVMGGSYAGSLAQAFVTEALVVDARETRRGVGFRLVYDLAR